MGGMTLGRVTLPVRHRVPDFYHQDDIIRGLRASLVAVLAAALASNENNFDFLRGVFSLARSQAALYGVHWADIIVSLREVPELWCLVEELQAGAMTCLEQRMEVPEA